jgi:hypothetical protein
VRSQAILLARLKSALDILASTCVVVASLVVLGVFLGGRVRDQKLGQTGGPPLPLTTLSLEGDVSRILWKREMA